MRVDQGRESVAALNLKEVGEELVFAGEEQQKEIQCAADEGGCGLVQREW